LTKRYWNGSIRLFSDLCWCFAISVFFAIFHKEDVGILRILGSTLGLFFTFFFYSWNKEHLKNPKVKAGIHILVGLFVLMPVFIFSLVFSNPRCFFSSYMGWYIFITPFVWSFFVFRKYKRLMWPKVQN
jgi:hypothetical protein